MKTGTILLSVLFCLALSAQARAGDAGSFTLQPQTINIGAGYDGTTIEASGRIPADSAAYLRLLGASCEHRMKEKGKLFGLMWMNLDSLVLQGLPSVCIIEGGDPESRAASTLRLESLGRNARIESKSLDRERAFKEFIKLKEQEGLYLELAGGISYGPPEEGWRTFNARIPVPSRITPGNYIIELYTVRNGSVIDRGEQDVSVKLVGFPAFLADLAFGHGALYGILATTIALISGLAIGLLFQSKGSH